MAPKAHAHSHEHAIDARTLLRGVGLKVTKPRVANIICRMCKRVEPLPQCPVEDRTIRIPKMGFRDVSHRLEFFGVCPDCHERSA